MEVNLNFFLLIESSVDSSFSASLCCFVGHLGHSKRNSVLKTGWFWLFACLSYSPGRVFQVNILILFQVEKPKAMDSAVPMERLSFDI